MSETASDQPTWVAEVAVDQEWYAEELPDQPLPADRETRVIPLPDVNVLVGRASESAGIAPQLDIGDDTGVSRRHCRLIRIDHVWTVEDLMSANGTYVASPDDPLPVNPVPAASRRTLEDGEYLLIGGWTRITLRPGREGDPS